MSIHDSTKLCCGPFCVECETVMEQADATIAELRAEVATLGGEIETMGSECQRLENELAQLREDRSWLTEQWQRHRKALNAIAWGEYDNVAFCRRLAQDELAIGVKAANDRAAATVKATDASGALGRAQ